MFRSCRIISLVVLVATLICGFANGFAFAAEGLWSGKEVPLAGEILRGGEKLGDVDRMMKDILSRHEIPGAAVAVTHNGRLILARGYGWADINARQVVQPTTLFDLASVSKPITWPDS